MKIVAHVAGYFALLCLSLGVALNGYMDVVDPAVPSVQYPFWESGLGELVWFGAAAITPALALAGFRYLMRRIWRSVPDEPQFRV